uniref:AnkC n=1 Tax=Anaplasma marginale TaxID=770 RepID=F8U698_ANAMA|nr:AnkC [Anaplasma marginale]
MCGVRRVFLTGVLCTVFCSQECIASSSSSGTLDFLLGEVSKRAETMIPSVESGISGIMTWRKGGDDKSKEQRSNKEVSVDDAQKRNEGEKKPPVQGSETTGDVVSETTSDVVAETNAERVQDGDRGESAGDSANLPRGKARHWPHRRAAHPYIETDAYNNDNMHLPRFHRAEDYYAHVFYCAKANDITGLLAVVDELAAMGKNQKFVMEEMRANNGDNLLIYAVRHGAIDTVRYLLSNGADVSVKNDRGETPLSVAIDKGRVDMINAISEMQVGFSEEEQEG